MKGAGYTVKRYDSTTVTGPSGGQKQVALKPVNPAFAPLLLTATDGADIIVVAELMDVLLGTG